MTPIASNKDVTDTPEAQTSLLGGRVFLRQPQKGYRIGMDGALLAAACAGVTKGRGKWARALELGCGVGGALLSLAARVPGLDLTGLERDAAALAFARENVVLNGAEGRATIIDGDVGKGFRTLDVPRFDLVFSNPPYFDDPDTLRAPHELKRPAWIADDGLGAWLEFAMAAVRDEGDIVFIHRADRLADLLTGLGAKCGSFQVLPIQPFADQPAKRVIVRAKRLGKAPLVLLPPLILHDRGERKHTPEVEAILRGEADLKWN
jgi:tRNA1(Val) A37 N6-methylase TrmN6